MNGSAASSLASPSIPAPPVAPRTRMLLEAPIVPTLLRLAAPNVLNLLAFVGLITFDGLFVGRLGPDALAGISLVFPWVMLMQHGAASGMGGAVSSAVARALGAKQKERANALATHAVWLALMLSAFFSCLMLLAGPVIYRWMGGQGAILEAAIAYSNVAFGGALSIWMLNLLCNVVRGTGNMGLPAAVIVVSVLGHIVISPMLIFGFGPIPALGLAGAGWGLVTSFGLGSVFLLAYLRSARSLISLSFRGVRFQWALPREFFRVGVPGMLNVAITNLTVIALTGVAGHLSRDTAIAYAMGARLEYIIIPLGFGIGTGIVALVGTNWGAKQYARARAVAWSGGAVAAAACGAVGLFFALFPQLWMSIFTSDEEIMRIGVSYLQIVGPAYALYGFGIGLYFACQGYGNLMLAVVANASRLLLAAGGALIAVFWIEAGTTGIFAAIALGFVAYAALTSVALSRINVTAKLKGSTNMKFLVFVAAMAIAGCGNSGSTVSESAKVEMRGAVRLPYASLLEARRAGGEETLRVRVDAARNRLWVLGLNHVDVYGIAESQLIRRIELPGSFVAELVCLPDMALDRSGTAFISHNLQPMLWQIDADSFQLKEHVIRLLNKEHWDIGFGGLAFAPDGALFGVTASDGSRWSIDIGNASAHQVELKAFAPDPCDPSVAPVGVRSRAEVEAAQLSDIRRYGYVAPA